MKHHIIAYIGLGGNIGDVHANMQTALEMIHADDNIEVLRISSVYKTPPWGIKNQNWFLNACACLKTTLTAHELLQVCLEVEKQLKRVRQVRWGPRTIDLDILVFGDERIEQEDLQIPHPRMHERAFVIQPMMDLAPELTLQGKTISKWLSQIDIEDIKKADCELRLNIS